MLLIIYKINKACTYINNDCIHINDVVKYTHIICIIFIFVY